ncbi:HD domain-containing protein [bacterium]
MPIWELYMDAEKYIELFRKAGELKKVARAGWMRRGVELPESVADHSFRTAFIAMMLAERLDLDVLKLVKMCLVHDLAESVTGDITPFDGVGPGEKRKLEEAAVTELMKDIPGGGEVLELWREYEAGETPEAAAARRIDKIEMALQAREYQEEFPEKDLAEFLSGMKEKSGIALLDEIAELLKKQK